MKLFRRILAVALVGFSLAACGGTSALTGDQTGFVSADGSAVLRDVSARGDAVSLTVPVIASSEEWNLADHRGEVVLLNAWGPWCAPCRKEVPQLQKLSDSLKSRGLLIVGLATRTNDTAVLAFADKNGVTLPQLADFDSAALASLRGIPSATVPGTIFIDREGRIAGWALGAADPALIESLTKSLLDEKVTT